MQMRRGFIGLGYCALVVFGLSNGAQAITPEKARNVIDAILMQSGATAELIRAKAAPDGAVDLTYDNVSLHLSGYATPRSLALDGVNVTVRDTDQANQVDLDIKLPEHGKVLAEATSDQRDLTMRNAGGYIRWDIAQNAPVTVDASADFLIGDEPITRKHWLINGLVLQWLPEMARVAWQDAEWTGPNREKRGATKAANLTLYPGENGGTHLDYAHDGLWLPSLIQPRTVRVKSHSDGLPWSEAKPIVEKGIIDMLTGTAPRVARRQIGDALWLKAEQNGAPIKVDEFYVQARGLEALGSGEFYAQTAARYGFTGDFDFKLLGQDKLVALLGTPESPTLLGALVPYAVNGLATGRPGPQGTTEYDGELLADGRLIINGLTLFQTADGR